MTRTPTPEPCTDPRHTGRIREQLGCTGPDPAAPIEVGQTYRPTPYNAARLPDDRATVTRVWTPDGQSEQSVAYDIATVDHRGRPSTTHSALAESVFRKSYVLATPESAPESPTDIVARAVALLDSLDAVTYAIVTPDTADTIAVKGRTKGMNVTHGVEGLRSLADAITIREAQRRATAATEAQAFRQAADAVESRNDGCPDVGTCQQCKTRTAEATKLRAAATELEAGR
ncbi:hypothetical protein ABZ567_31320 [Streptomyces sp. NPDC016459]|uniref:hypothetical protein n=1 Tax=Streptomyces sp. NPDC016459 TaxID=3157190 RepID=UPI00341177E2